MKKTTFFNSDENRIEKAKRWLHIVTVCFLLFLGQAGFSQSVATQTFNFNGYDDAGTQFSILPANINVNEGQAIQQITIVGFEGHYNSTTGSDGCSSTSPDEYDWFSFNLSVTGGEADGTVLSGVCGDAIIDTDVTNFSNITISINDTDDWSDMVYFNITLEVTYETPTCPMPVGAVVANITPYGADISWDESLSESTIGYEYVVATSSTPPAGSGTPTEDGNIYTVIDGLNPMTTYYVFVRGICESDEFSAWSSPVSFTTLCAPITTFPFLETFDTFLPNECWTLGDNGDLTNGPATFGSSSWTADGFDNQSGTGAIRCNLDYIGDNDWIISPEFTIPTTGYELKFDVAVFQWASTAAPTNPWEADDFVEVLINVDGNTNWEILHTFDHNNVPSNSGDDFHVEDLDEYAGETIRIAFRAVEGSNDGATDLEFIVDNFQIRQSPLCPDQTGLVIANVTSDGASTSWDDMSAGGAIEYEYAITTSATPPDSGETTEDTFFDAFDLESNTVYYLHVRSSCADGEFGIWSTKSFRTACSPFTEFSENFDSVTRPQLPSCWGKILSGDTLSTFATVGTSSTHSSEPNGIDLYNSSSGSASNIMLVSPLISNLSEGTHRLKFRARNSTASQDLQVGVLTDVNDASTFTVVQDVDITTTFESYAVNFDNYSGPGVAIAIRRLSTSTYTNVYLDDIVWEAMPTCPDQTGLVVSGITSESANTSWDDMSAYGVQEYEYAVTTSATPPAAGETTEDLYYEANGLDSNTTYYLHVRTICGDDSLGVWTTLLFKTQVAPSTIPWVEGFTTTTALGWNVNNYTIDAANALIGGWPGSPKFGDGSTNIIRRNPYEYSSTGNFTTNSVGLVEEGHVLSFDYKLINYSLGDDNPPAEGSGYFIVEVSTDFGDTYQLVEQIDNNGLGGWQPKTISLDDFAGDYVKIRITDTWNSGDYYIGFDNFYIGVPPTCPTVTGLVVSNITSQSADTSWNDMSEEGVTAYEYAITTSATPPASGDGEPISDTFYEASGLEGNTVYYLHVRANCDDDLGNWATTSFTTQVAPSAIPWTEGFDTTTAPGWLANGYTLELASASIGSPSAVKFGDGTTRIVRRNPWSLSTTGNFTSNSVGVVSAGDILSFDYKLINYADANTPAANSGSFKVEISTDFGATYELLETVVNNGIAGWQNEVYELDDYEGDYVRIKITDTWTSGDYFIGFDNFYIGQDLSNSQFDKSALKVYPNPTKNILFVTYSQEISNVEIYNLVGQRVATIAPNANEGQIDMSNLASGAYFVKVTSNNTTSTVKVIKE
jgi:hypothetical protein